ncbi:MAG: lipopolysaccharide biosynthesis protein [Ignavibacteria bacterium]|nr:lipopolysaccharide biosynthesis protein [Ignavibacteria bacterium]
MDVKSEIRSGTFWLVGFRYAGLFIQIIISAILARILSPEEFGIVAVVTVFVNFFILLSDSGIGSAVIQRTNITESETFSLLIITILLSLFLSLVLWFMGNFISQFYNNPEYTRIAHLLSISLFFYTANAIPSALLFKQKKFKQSGLINISVQFISGIGTIILAYSGFSYDSIIYGNILNSILIFFISLKVVKIRFFKKIGFDIIKQIFNYSFFQWISNILTYFSRNLDNLLIGKFLGVTALGNYDRAYSLVMLPVSQISKTINTVLHPVLATFQAEPNYIYDVYKKVAKYLSILGLPLSIFLYFSAEEIIIILYGSKWYSAIPSFKYLSLSIGFQMMYVSAGSIFLALGKTKYLFYTAVLMAISTISGILCGIFIGNSINSVAFFLIFSFTLNFFIAFYILVVKLLQKRISDFISALLPGIKIALAVLFINVLFSEFVVMSNFLIFNLVFKLTISFIVFSGILFLIKEHKNVLSLFGWKN